MSGIYIHIPFCKKACHYCNFHFSTSLKLKDAMVEAIVQELSLRRDYLSSKSLTSIYLGGGTPSLLNEADLNKLFSILAKEYSWDETAEITLESNPDDLSADYLRTLKKAGINRLSIGIQSFDQSDLLFMNRAHTAREAEDSIKLSQDIGFENISADLIYASPTTSNEVWIQNIQKLTSFNIPHISSYCLTVEEGTALHHFVKTGQSKAVDEVKSEEQFNILIDALNHAGYDHYEISNFGKPGKYAVHNTNYWMGKPYLGVGPGAHSFDGHNTRSWNIAHNPKYIASIQDNVLPIEHESLSNKEQYNEMILIRLRTKWGINDQLLQSMYPSHYSNFKNQIGNFIDTGAVIFKDGNYTLTLKGKHIADRISMELFTD